MHSHWPLVEKAEMKLLAGLILSKDCEVGICLVYFSCCDKIPKQRELNGKGV